MEKVLILGSNGMLGHKLYQVLSSVCDVTGTIRGNYGGVSKYGFFEKSRIVPDINALEILDIDNVIQKTRPDVVINCIGIVKALEDKSGRLLKTTEVNEVFKVDNRWYPKKMIFKDVLSRGKGTEYIIETIDFNAEVPDHMLTKAALRQ